MDDAFSGTLKWADPGRARPDLEAIAPFGAPYSP